jgi:hypothetical protein
MKMRHRELIFDLFIKREYEMPFLKQTRRDLELGFQEIEQQTRSLVADMVESLWEQQCRVIGLKQGILHQTDDGSSAYLKDTAPLDGLEAWSCLFKRGRGASI